MALSGDVKALIQANNEHVFAGTNNSARIYRSLDNGQTFTQMVALGSGADSVNAFAWIRNSNTILAVVTGSAGAQGIWRSTDNGVGWTRVKTHPASLGYNDIANYQQGSRVLAVGPAVSAGQNNVSYSSDGGATWTDITSIYYRNILSIATTIENFLATYYAEEHQPAAIWWTGIDSYYTELHGYTSPGGAQNVPLLLGFGTVGGGAGNGGLDMTAFIVRDSTGTLRRRALWAVRSHLNTNNTEIWGWPVLPISPNTNPQWAKLNTIVGKIFYSLYADPIDIITQVQTAFPRTIWAGSAGEIWVSVDSGLTWALSTTAPTGNIYSFVRTTAGVMIAGGAAGEIFLFGGTGSEGGGGGGAEEPPEEPEDPDDPGIVTSRFLGRTETCDNEVFVSNKFSFSNLTHVFHYDGSAYSILQYANVPPYEILGATAVVNKAVYFGSKTNDPSVPGGSFSSLIFDITRIAENITVVWEYWTGAAWATLTVRDNTDQFKLLGVNSVSWEVPSNWAELTINSVFGYWVRARISAVAASPVTPVHDNRFIYTTLLPYVEIAAANVQGDLPAIGRVTWYNQSGLSIERVLCGLRSVDRGANFNPYINISDTQLLFGLTIADGTEAGVAFANDATAPTGRVLSANYSSGGDLNDWNDLAVITLSNTVAREYHGYYRALLRLFYNNATVNSWNLRIQMRFGSGGMRLNTRTAYPTPQKDWEVVDFGQLAISTREISNLAGSLSDQMQIAIQGYATATGKQLTLYDLVLIPIDEWVVDAQITDLTPVGTPEIFPQYFLDVDSISNPKIAISAVNRNSAGLIVSKYQNVNNGPMILQQNKDQRLWFLNMSYENYWRSYPEGLGSVQVFKQQQYLGYRGAR